jgi:hypothetical protein
MDNKKTAVSEVVYSLQIGAVVALALLIAVPVYFYMRKANNIGESLTSDRLDSFVSQTAELDTNAEQYGQSRGPGGIDVGPRRTRYSNTGQAILTVNYDNITKFTAQDFKQVGSTPWSLTNTVDANLAIPAVISVVFDNANVVEGFFERTTTQELVSNPERIIGMINNNDAVVQRFFADPVIQEALDNEPVMTVISESALFTQLLQTPAGQYFLRNPKQARQLVADSKSMAPLLQNAALRKLLLSNPSTQRAAEEFFN